MEMLQHGSTMWKMTGKALLLCSALWVGMRLHAQTYPEAGVGLAFNTTDVISDFTFGADVSDARLSIKASFQTRIGTKRVLVESGTPNLVYQFQERRYLFGLEGDKRFNLTQEGEYTEVGLFVGGFIGFTAYDYRGTANPQNVGIWLGGHGWGLPLRSALFHLAAWLSILALEDGKHSAAPHWHQHVFCDFR
jgi:hypothetical protein